MQNSATTNRADGTGPRRWLRLLATGIGATLGMDLGSALLRATRLTQGLPPNLIGRWFTTLVRGPRIATTIADVPAVRGDRSFEVVAALAFGLLTNLLPWFWMFPAMGYGRFGGAAPAEWLLARTSFANHACFALGLAVLARWGG